MFVEHLAVIITLYLYLFAVELSATSKKSILWAVYDPLERDSETEVQQLWVAQEGLGCLLRIQPGGLSPNKYAPLEDSWEVNIVSMMFMWVQKEFIWIPKT